MHLVAPTHAFSDQIEDTIEIVVQRQPHLAAFILPSIAGSSRLLSPKIPPSVRIGPEYEETLTFGTLQTTIAAAPGYKREGPQEISSRGLGAPLKATPLVDCAIPPKGRCPADAR